MPREAKRRAIRGFEGDPYDYLPESRECMACGEEKPARDFTVIYHHRDGLPRLYSYCQPCQSRRVGEQRYAQRRAEGKPTPQTKLHFVRYAYRGEEYTLGQLAALPECSVSYYALQKRLAEGIPVEVAVTRPVDPGVKTGEEAPTYAYRDRRLRVKDLLALPGCVVERTTLSERLRAGWSAEAAVSTPPDERFRNKPH